MKFTMRSRSILPGLVVFLAAFLCRASLYETARFLGDQSIFFHILREIDSGTSFPVLGPALSGGVAKVPGAAFFYLMTMSQWFSPTPEAANIWASFLCSLGVLFFWGALELEFGKRYGLAVAFVPALLLAFSPWSILFGESLDNGYVLSFFVGAAFLITAAIRRNPSSPLIALFVVVCAIMPQFHLSCPSVWAGLFALLWPFRRELRWSWVVAGVTVGCALYFPYFNYELQTGWANLRAFRAESASGYHLDAWKPPLYLFKFLTVDTAYQELHGYWGGMSERWAFVTAIRGSKDVRPFNVLRLAAYLSSIVFAIQILRQAYLKRGILGDYFWALVVAFGANIGLLLLSGKSFYPHYSQPLLMFVFALIPAWVIWAQSQSKGWQKWGVLVLIFCAGSFEATQTVSRVSDARIGLGVGRDLVEKIIADADREHWPEGAVVAFQEPELPVRPEFVQPLMTDLYHRDITLVAAAPHPQASYVVELGPYRASDTSVRPLAGGLMMLRRVR